MKWLASKRLFVLEAVLWQPKQLGASSAEISRPSAFSSESGTVLG